MADSYIQVPADGSGKKLDADSLTVGANTVYRERDRIAGTAADELAEVRDTDADEADHGLVVRPIDVVSPVATSASSSALAAGGSVDLDSSIIPASTTGKLMAVLVASSAPCKWVVKTRNGVTEVTVGVLFTSGLAGQRPSDVFRPPDKRFCSLAGAGVDENFRVTVTNLDQENAADVYATFYHDEIAA